MSKLIRNVMPVLAAALLSCVLMGCEQKGPMERAGENMDDAMEEMKDAAEELTE